jgi:bifunctional pyridoxal-dependent enzyme with beta-cystathionase and maltose regulon repressor activities
MMNHLQKIREICLIRLNNMPGVSLDKFEGTYVPLIKFDYDMSSKEMFDYLLSEAKVALAPGSNYGQKGEGFQRICIATSENIIEETLNRIETAIKAL